MSYIGCNFENKLENISKGNILLKMTHFKRNIFKKKLIQCPIFGCNCENISMENILLKMSHFIKNIFQKPNSLTYIFL